jgi:hypothetical protein
MRVLRILLRIVGTLAGALAAYCLNWANYQSKMKDVALRVGDQDGVEIHGASASESLTAALVFGGAALACWVISFFLYPRAAADRSRPPVGMPSARRDSFTPCPHCGNLLPAGASFCRECKNWLK